MELIGNYTTERTAANLSQLEARTKLDQLKKESPLNAAELERNPALYIRSSLLARIITFNDIYKLIQDTPGHIFDLGSWWGQASILMENFRALYEPFNKQRKIISFDTFEGYTNWSDKDITSHIFNEGTYSTGASYQNYFDELMKVHESNNALNHITGIHESVKGDATKTVKEYLSSNPETIVSLALFDLGTYNATRSVLETIKPHLIPGSVIAMIHLTRKDLCGDGQAFLHEFRGMNYSIEKMSLYPSISVVRLK